MSGKGSRRRPASAEGKLNWERYWKAKEEQRLRETQSREEIYEELTGQTDECGTEDETDGSGTG